MTVLQDQAHASAARALEIIVLSLDDALAAEAGGATRLEVVRDIHEDGLTPDRALVEQILERVTIPLRVMVRPRNVFVVGDEAHREAIARDAAGFADLPVDLVTGYVRVDREGRRAVDEAALALVAGLAPRARITFHRAVERLDVDPAPALGRCPAVDRVLSGGGEGTWDARSAALERLQAAIAPASVIVGGGVTLDGMARLAACPSLREVHLGRLARAGASFTEAVDARVVADLRTRWFETLASGERA